MATVRRTTRTSRPGAGWVRVTRGAGRTADVDRPDRADLLAFATVLPDAARLTHLTAAGLRGWWLPPLPDGLPAWWAVPRSSRLRRPGPRYVRLARLAAPTTIDGLQVDEAAEVLLACARDLADLDLLILLTSALRCGDVDRGRITDLACSGRPGAPALGRALATADPRCESAYEVLLLRLHQVLDVEVEPQHEVRTDDGAFVARGDLWLVGTRRLHEYDGADHLVRSRQRKDLKRDGRLSAIGWERRGYTRPDVLHQAVRILRDADEATGRPHEPARARAWHALLAASLFSPAGTARLLARVAVSTSGARGSRSGATTLPAAPLVASAHTLKRNSTTSPSAMT